jgi:acetyltransferase-like isoleucine patch superfamily enzyme
MEKISPTAEIHESVELSGGGRLVIEDFAVVERNVTIDLGASPAGRVDIGARVKLKQGAVVRAYNGSVTIRSRASIGEYTVLAGHGGITIGAATIISGHCYVGASGHIFSGNVPIRFQGERAQGIEVEGGVWMGAHVVVQDGVCIERGAVIGSGAVVTRSMPGSAICFGVPCRAIAHRPKMDSSLRTDEQG